MVFYLQKQKLFVVKTPDPHTQYLTEHCSCFLLVGSNADIFICVAIAKNMTLYAPWLHLYVFVFILFHIKTGEGKENAYKNAKATIYGFFTI